MFDDDAVDPLLPGFLGHQRQAELLAHHGGKEAADRVLLPARYLYNGGDRCTLRLRKKGENGFLFAPATARS
jgi:hypothetical protein